MLLTIFSLSGELLAVDTAQVREITLMARLSRPSGAPLALAGFLNVGQEAVPILRLDRLLSLPEAPLGLYTQILILREGVGTRIGWIVDRVEQIVPVRSEELLGVPENHCFRDWSRGLYARDGAAISVLDPERVLVESERHRIAEFEEKEQARLRELEAVAT